MTQEPQSTPEVRRMTTNVKIAFDDNLGQPTTHINAVGATVANGTVFLDLGCVSPRMLVDMNLAEGNPEVFVRVPIQMKVAMTIDTANQMLKLIQDQLAQHQAMENL